MRSRLGKSGQYIEFNSKRFYYEIYGHGQPLMMFHGGLSTLETFRCQIPELSKHYRVVLPEWSGHGHSPDIPGAYSYAQMAEDWAALIQKLALPKVRAVGYSDGANLLLHLALKHPQLIQSMVLIGGNFHYDGCDQAFTEKLKMIPEDEVGEEGIDEKYARYSPDGANHYPVVFNKVKNLWLSQPTFTTDDIAKIHVPSLIISGDHDMIRLDHTLQLYESLQEAQLLVVSGTTHGVTKECPEIVNKAILRFLKNPVWVDPYAVREKVT